MKFFPLLSFILTVNLFGKEINERDFKIYITKFEGYNHYVYKDKCGYQDIIGIGHFLPSNTYTYNLKNYYDDQSIDLFYHQDLVIAIQSARRNLSVFNTLSPAQQFAILNLIWSVGPNGFKKFAKFIAAIQNNNYQLAQQEILNSLWAKQVGEWRRDMVVNALIVKNL